MTTVRSFPGTCGATPAALARTAAPALHSQNADLITCLVSLPLHEGLPPRLQKRCIKGVSAMSEGVSAAPWRCRPGLARLWLPSAFGGVLAGCSSGSAPALVLFGAYFPGWLLFAILAIVIALVARIAFGLAGLALAVPFPLFTYLSMGILVAGAVDLLWLGH